MNSRKWITGIALALWAVAGAFAQDTAIGPVATLEAGDFRALAVTANGERLLVGDAENDQVRVYTFDDPSNPQLINAVDLDGNPVALVGAEGFGLTAVTADRADLLQVIAQPSYNPRQGYINYGTYDVTPQPVGMAISPSSHWAVVYGENGWTLLELVSPDEINSTTLAGGPVRGAALTNDALFLLPADTATVEVATIQRGPQLGETRQFALSAPGHAIAINTRGTLGAVLLENNLLVLFDPSSLREIDTVALRGQFDQLNFVTREDAEEIVLTQFGQDTLSLLDVTDPRSIGQLSTAQLGSPIQALTVYNSLIIVSDEQTVSIFETE